MVYLRVFLKVCEGCGSLWFRAQDRTEVYCPGCAATLRSLPPGKRSRRGRRPRHRSCQNSETIAGGAA